MENKTMLYCGLLVIFFVKISSSSFEEAETAEISPDLDDFGLPSFDIHDRVRRDTDIADTDADDRDADDTDSESQEDESIEFQDDHTYYTSKVFYPDDIDKYWIPLQNDSKHHVLSKTYMYGVRENVTFDFRFYGHNIHRVVLTNAGFISTSPLFHNKMYDTQYIAPYMAPYDPTLTESSNVLYEVIGGEKFVVEWQDVFVLFKDNLIGPFHFQAIIHNDGRIMFLYKKLPGSFSGITVGLAESAWFDTDRPTIKKYYNYNKVVINSMLIKNGTVVSLFPLPTCNLATDCHTCVSRNISFDCKWCDVLDKCSDGMDRHSQAWGASGCYNNATSHCNDQSTDQQDSSDAEPGTTKTNDSSYTTEEHSTYFPSHSSSSPTEKPQTISSTATGGLTSSIATKTAYTSAATTPNPPQTSVPTSASPQTSVPVTASLKPSAVSAAGRESSAPTSANPQTGALSTASPSTNVPSTSNSEPSAPPTAHSQTSAPYSASRQTAELSSADSHTTIQYTESQQTTRGQDISTDNSDIKNTNGIPNNGADGISIGAQRSGASADNSGSSPTAMIVVLVVVGVALVVSVCGVFLYAYTHPSSRPAIWFLEHRPSNLVVRFRNGRNQEPTETTPVTQA